MNIVWFLLFGLVVGFIARASIPMTIILGVVGSFVGGFIGAIFKKGTKVLDFSTAGLFGSVIGAVILVLLYRKFGNKLKR
jgi:uncharacterized membrane protein YeaQ/YmgE (transglycosylase-associated protein family)